MKKLLVFVLAMSLLLISCGGSKDKVKIVGAYSDFNDTFLSYLRQEMDNYAKSNYPDVEISFVDGRGDQATLQSALENVAVQKVDGVLINLANPEGASPVDKLFAEAKIPCLYFNRLPVGIPEGTYYFVGLNEFKSGEFQAEFVSKYRKSGKAVVIMGILGNDSVIKRTQGVKDYIKANNLKIDIVREQTSNWKREEALRLTETWLTAGVKFDIIFANNDESALGAAQAVLDAGKKIGTGDGEIIITGIDATPDGRSGIKEGVMSMTVLQDPITQARASIDNIIKIIKGESVEKVTLLSPEVITKDNVDK